MIEQLHETELVIKHSEILVKISEQIQSACRKIEQLEKFLLEQIKARDKELDLARQEMERRLNGITLEAYATKKEVEMMYEKLTGHFDMLAQANRERIDILDKSYGERQGARKWSDHIITVIIATVVMLGIHYAFKF